MVGSSFKTTKPPIYIEGPWQINGYLRPKVPQSPNEKEAPQAGLLFR
jgi:hypothetical protein